MKTMTNFKSKMKNGTCPWTPERTSKGHQKDTNNNDNNIYLLLLNKYKQNFPSTYAEKIKLIGRIKKSEEYNSLPVDKQEALFVEMMNYRRV